MDYAVQGILQARILGWVAFPLSRGSSQPRDQTRVSSAAGGFFTSWATKEAPALEDKVLITEPPGKSPSVLLFLKEHRIRPHAFMGHFIFHTSPCGISNLPYSCSLFLLYVDMLLVLYFPTDQHDWPSIYKKAINIIYFLHHWTEVWHKVWMFKSSQALWWGVSFCLATLSHFCFLVKL